MSLEQLEPGRGAWKYKVEVGDVFVLHRSEIGFVVLAVKEEKALIRWFITGTTTIISRNVEGWKKL